MITYTDTTPMPFGKYKGTAMANVPAWYLIWLYREGSPGVVKPYIQENFDVLLKEAEKSKKKY